MARHWTAGHWAEAHWATGHWIEAAVIAPPAPAPTPGGGGYGVSARRRRDRLWEATGGLFWGGAASVQTRRARTVTSTGAMAQRLYAGHTLARARAWPASTVLHRLHGAAGVRRAWGAEPMDLILLLSE